MNPSALIVTILLFTVDAMTEKLFISKKILYCCSQHPYGCKTFRIAQLKEDFPHINRSRSLKMSTRKILNYILGFFLGLDQQHLRFLPFFLAIS
jgi:hypothetical protein